MRMTSTESNRDLVRERAVGTVAGWQCDQPHLCQPGILYSSVHVVVRPSLLLPLLLLLASTPVTGDGSSADTAAAAATVDVMVSWLEESGADLSAVRVGTGVGGERGVQAARDFAPGETILRGTPTSTHTI
jgi:hypothetical protein